MPLVLELSPGGPGLIRGRRLPVRLLAPEYKEK